jgi:macrolide phosphotransferase
MERASGESRVLDFMRKHLPVAVPEWRLHTECAIASGILIWNRCPLPLSIRWLRRWQYRTELMRARLRRPVFLSFSPSRSEDVFRNKWTRRGRRWMFLSQCGSAGKPGFSDDTYWPRHSALMHGDLHPPHLLVDEDSKLVGLLDWTESQVADAATDFSLMYGIIGGAVLDRLLTRY